MVKEADVTKHRTPLDPNRKSSLVERFEEALLTRVVGQEHAVTALSSLYEVALAGLSAQNRPIGSMLLLGPTGTGKTWLAEAASEVLYGGPSAVVRIDCAEYQYPHEIAKLIGYPPGYVGHGGAGTAPLFSQESLDRRDRWGVPIALILFDEIEKASPALWQLLLAVLDRGALTLGDNRRVDLTRAIVIMSSNIGAEEISTVLSKRIGFASPSTNADSDQRSLGDQVRRAAVEAARHYFSPEFLNRIDNTVVLRPIGATLLRDVLDLELVAVQKRILRNSATRFLLQCGPEARELLLREGTDRRYGAREIKRAIDRLLLAPLARLITSGQVGFGDVIDVQVETTGAGLSFHRLEGAKNTLGDDARVHVIDTLRRARERERQTAFVVATAVAVSAAVGLATGLTAAGRPLRRSA